MCVHATKTPRLVAPRWPECARLDVRVGIACRRWAGRVTEASAAVKALTAAFVAGEFDKADIDR